MKKPIGMALIRLLQLLSVVFLSAEAFCREPNPPEIQALIGMKIPAKTELKTVFDKGTERYEIKTFTSRDSIPKFNPVDQELLTNYKNTNSFGFEAGYIGKTASFIIVLLNRDQSIEITDAISIPPGVPEWQMRNGNIYYDSRKYRLSTECSYSNQKKDIGSYIRMIGFVKPQKGKSDCTHMSERIRQAWGINGDTGRISGISTVGLLCQYSTMNDCK